MAKVSTRIFRRISVFKNFIKFDHCKILIKQVRSFVLLLAFPWAAFADDQGGSVNQILSNLTGLLTGTIGTSIATVAVISLGFGCFIVGRISKKTFFTTFAGIALIFGGSTLVNALLQGVSGGH